MHTTDKEFVHYRFDSFSLKIRYVYGHAISAMDVKLRHFSSCIRGFRQYPSCMRSFSEKKFEHAPILLSYGLSDSKNKIRCGMIVARNDGKNAADESSSSESVITENTTSNDQFLSSDQPQVKGMEETPPQMPKPMLKRAPLTAREKLRAARVLSKYSESKPIKPAMGSKVLDALRETDKGKKRSGLPEAPTNLFDDSNRGLEKEGWKFQLPGGNDLFVVAFSFVFISTVMFGTTYVVWKLGAIHFNEF
ncbi:hypothetical protein IEQ34_016739 [Dendrobium chrysotoxum]|uniref:Uncharacterized protein n=1 Tax=Dendrobium chrysotoxum TaxID=161865 RepID=A0AAV7FYH7_DENCH|nr:hypothetical protein IEQ34_016739 [Dendrobium chrysotoxum]